MQSFHRPRRNPDRNGVIGQIRSGDAAGTNGDMIPYFCGAKDTSVDAQGDIISEHQFAALNSPPAADAVAPIKRTVISHDGIAVNNHAQYGMSDSQPFANGRFETKIVRTAQKPQK